MSTSPLTIQPAGSGKTVLSSTINEAVNRICDDSLDRRAAMFYFDFQESAKQEIEPLLGAILRQLIGAEDRLPQFIITMYQTYKNKGQSPSVRDLEQALSQTLNVSTKETYIVLDALDECPYRACNSSRKQIFQLLAALVANHDSNLHILATSRDEADIRSMLESIPHRTVCLKAAKMDADILKYVRSCLNDEICFTNLPEASRPEIMETILKRAQGMLVGIDLPKCNTLT